MYQRPEKLLASYRMLPGLDAPNVLKNSQNVKEGDVYKTDYSGFDRETWPPRTNKRHRENANKTRKAKTPKQRTELESALGARYSELYRLRYFDCIRFTVIDPMHNLLLGTGKKVFKTWRDQKILSSENLLKIQEFIDSIVVPPGTGRIPNKIAGCGNGLSADQWKAWILIYSP